MEKKKLEIMAPAGNFECLAAAIQGGADSVYFGVEKLNMRSHSANNFKMSDLKEIVRICSEAGVKTYLTLNIVLYGDDLEDMRKTLDAAKEAGITAVIASDMAAIAYARQIGLEVHISTQLSISNAEALRFYAQFADVIVLARELNLGQVKEIKSVIDRDNICGPSGRPVEIEMFAHGALCMAISGKCYLSLHEYGASANRGSCYQICRRGYEVKDAETGNTLLVDNKYIMSPKDLCTIEFMVHLIRGAGVCGRQNFGPYRRGGYSRVRHLLRPGDAGGHPAPGVRYPGPAVRLLTRHRRVAGQRQGSDRQAGHSRRTGHRLPGRHHALPHLLRDAGKEVL